MTSILDNSVRSYFDATSIRTITGTLGLLVAAILIALLCEREVLSVVRAKRRSRLIAVEAVLIPLAAAFLIVVVLRFDRLSV